MTHSFISKKFRALSMKGTPMPQDRKANLITMSRKKKSMRQEIKLLR